MQAFDHISGPDLRAGRMLVQMDLREAGKACRVSHDTLQRLEAGIRVRPKIKRRIVEALYAMGVDFVEPGYVRHVSHAVAPTVSEVGAFHGLRMRKARWRLAWTQEKLASEAAVSLNQVRVMEAGEFLNIHPTLALYRVVKALQMAGTVFGRRPNGSGDRCLVPRPIMWKRSRNPMRDYRAQQYAPRYDESEWDDAPPDLSKVKPADFIAGRRRS
jgi:DNA-binding XRE family transcriptional regulator